MANHFHRNIHTGDKRHRRDMCGESYKQKTSLINHILDHTGGEKLNAVKPVINYLQAIFTKEIFSYCVFCGHSISLNMLKGNLNRHMLVHSCDKCRKSLASIATLHMNIHTGFTCEG